MGRPEPCVLFAQTFVHPQLDEYVDEVIFAEPIVITACEILEHNASSASPAVTLIGATSPPSFALEVFVQCEGETRFRRLCQSFLYSHSSSNLLEVEAVVTSHLVVRGSYRSLSLVIYGNTAEDLGQFNIEVDIDSSLTNTVFNVEGKLEDLPPALRPSNKTIEELLIVSPKALSLDVVQPDISVKMKQLLQLSFKLLRLSDSGDGINRVIKCIVSVASAYARHSCCRPATSRNKNLVESSKISEEQFHLVLVEVTKELSDMYVSFQHKSLDLLDESVADNTFMESETDLATSKQLTDFLNEHILFERSSEKSELSQISMNKSIILWSSTALLLCSGRESCFHFVNSGGMEKLCDIFCKNLQNSHAVTLMLLGVVEQATRLSIGCEGFLGWWPREDESVPSRTSKGYNHLLKLLMQKQPHDVASLATLILHRLRFYEVASRYESAVLSVLGSVSTAGRVTSVTLEKLTCARFQLKTLLKLINSRGPVEDPSLLASASRSLLLGQAEGILSYDSTSSLITSSSCRFSVWDIDSHLLSLLKDRGFFTLSAALFSSTVLRADTGQAMELFVDITSYLEATTLSLLSCRSGLVFLLFHPELSTTLILALKAADSLKKEGAAPLRYASLLISKGFFCHPEEIGIIVETYLRVVNAVDRLLASDPQSEEILWVLWELCRLSRSHCGREALLALGHFPEALSVLIAALHSIKELDPVTSNSGTSPLNLAVFHSAAEIFEVIVTDLTASSLGSWIGKAMELYKALHSSSAGSNRKDAPTRLLELIDASAVYHKKGGSGLLQYAAVLASGADSHAMMDIENITTESSTTADSNLIENLLGKPIFENSFRATVLRDSSVAQLTTAFQILASISENPAVAATLYNEGAVMVIHAVLIDCSLMLEKSSNNHDYLVDEGTEGHSTSDLLLERNREQSLVDLLITSLVLLISLLQRLQEAKEQHRNTKLMKALLQLHREMSPRLASCAADLSSPYPGSALGFEAVCQLLVSALACWPVYGWAPGLFSFLVDSLHATSLLTLGPKDACSLLCLLNDLFPEEGFWLWKNGMPMLSALRKLAVGTLLGPQKEKEIGWYLQPQRVEVLLGQLTPKIDKIALIVLHCAVSALVVIHDMLRVFVIRIACLNTDHAGILLRPIITTIHDRISESSSLSDTEAYKVYRLLEFLASMLEHPLAKPLLLKEGAVQILIRVLEKCIAMTDAEGTLSVAKCGFSQISWCVPVLKALSLIGDSRSYMQHAFTSDGQGFENMTADDCSRILYCLLKLCKVLPVGRELFACLSTFSELGSISEGKSALLSIFLHIQSCNLEEPSSDGRHDIDGSYKLLNPSEWKKSPPLLSCWITLLRSLDSKDIVPEYAIEAVGALSSGSLQFCTDGKSLNADRVAAVKYLFGLPFDTSGSGYLAEDNIKYIDDLVNLLCSKLSEEEYPVDSDMYSTLSQVHRSVKSLLSLLQKPIGSVDGNDLVSGDSPPLSSNDVLISTKMHKISDGSARKAEDYNFGALADKFLWECPENLRDRLSQSLPLKRKLTPLEATNRRQRGDSVPSESMTQTTFSRGSVPLATPSGPTRRDSFRQRKPNTSRPPSMHVDDYVARERNVDGTSSSNVIAIPRVGSSSGRPPSIHVDEFMARQRERQNPLGVTTGDAVAQVKSTAPANDTNMENSSKPLQIKPDLDDDLQGIDIVFDGEESESDDKLPFPQPDDNLTQPAPVVVEERSPHSIVEETESDVNSNSQFPLTGAPNASNIDDNTQSEFSSRMSVSRPEKPLTREPSISSERKYYDKSDDAKNVPIKTTGGFSSDGNPRPSSSYNASVYSRTSAHPGQLSNDSRMHQPYNSKNNLQPTGNAPFSSGSQGIYDPKFQPPLPPMPPPSTIAPVASQTLDTVPNTSSPFLNSMADLQSSGPPGFHHVHSDYLSALSNCSTSMVSSNLMPDPKYSRASLSSPGGSRPPPPLPPTPPPFLTANLGSSKPSMSPSSMYNQTSIGTAEHQQASGAPSNDPRLNNISASGALLTSYQPPLMPSMLFNRSSSVPGRVYASNPSSHHGENQPSISQNLPVAMQSIQPIQSLGQLQPLQPPQILRPPQPPQHLRPPIPASPQPEQSLLQSPVQMQLHPLQMLQQPQVSPFQVFYQPAQQENISNPPPHQQQVDRSHIQLLRSVGDGTSQQQDDPGMTLQHYFSSPEAIQSLLSDRDKLCQLLEEHPKLMQMLQERLPH